MSLLPRHPAIAVAVVAIVLAGGFLGTRGIWDPDEGRYTNVALVMLDSGDWLNPRRNHEVGHWSKPPLTYWAIAASLAAFGQNPWAARLPGALAYLACVWLTWRLARRLAPGAEPVAALAFATMVLPFGASQLITTDFLLAAFETLALLAYVESRAAGSRWMAWAVLMWVAFALAFLTKGPPGLLPLLAVAANEALNPVPGQGRWWRWSLLPVFAAVALPWYLAVIHGHPGLLAYFLGAEVVDRITTDAFRRHGQWYGWFTVYAPTLLLGSLPWTGALWRSAAALVRTSRAWRHPAARRGDGEALLLALWVLIPLAVFCLARSRLPTYVLPLFVPLALLIARQRHAEGRSMPPARWVVGWVGALLAVKVAVASWPTHKDASQWAEAIRARFPTPLREVVFVEDMARYGLRLYLSADVEKISLAPQDRAPFDPVYDHDLAAELAEREVDVAFVTKATDWPRVSERIRALGRSATPRGAEFQRRILFDVKSIP